ncbi:MAG: alpha/beta fold hydrolase [Cyclobacteriaceae bacterium]
MKALSLLLALALTIVSCNPNKESAVSKCDFATILPPADARCGYITVPENHEAPEGRKIQIAYVVLEARDSSAHADPVIYLSGGPGGSALDPARISRWYGHPFREKRDVILLDQRGIGYSSALPNMYEELFEVMAADATEEEELKMIEKLMSDYSTRCADLQIDLRNYNTFQNARDVGALMTHLGYEQYNLYGVSYGTRLARVVQDMFPAQLNSVILNSPNPIKGDMLVDRLQSYSLALSRVFEYCENNPDCKSANPALHEDYLRAINNLKEKPLELKTEGKTVYLNAQDGLFFVRRLLYGTNSRTEIPALIQEYLNGGGPIISELVADEYTPDYNFTMWFAVERHEMYDTSNQREVIDEVYASLPLFPARLGLFDAVYLSLEKFHDSGVSEAKKIFQISDTPTLITVNQFDPVTPPENGHIMMERLTNGHLFVLDEGGHGGGDVDCRNSVMISFMNDPNGNLDASCLNVYKE